MRQRVERGFGPPAMTPEERAETIVQLENERAKYGRICSDYMEGGGGDAIEYENAKKELDRLDAELEKLKSQESAE